MSEDIKNKIEENKEQLLNEISQEEQEVLEEDVAGGGNGISCSCGSSEMMR